MTGTRRRHAGTFAKRLQQAVFIEREKEFVVAVELLQHRAIQQGDLRVLKLAELRMNNAVRHWAYERSTPPRQVVPATAAVPCKNVLRVTFPIDGPSLWMRAVAMYQASKALACEGCEFEVSSAVPVYVFCSHAECEAHGTTQAY